MKASNAQIRSKVKELVDKWRDTVSPLGYWDIHLHFTDAGHLMAASANPAYKQLDLFFNLKRIRKECEDWMDVERTIIHELVHGPLWELGQRGGPHKQEEGIDRLEEGTVTDMAISIWFAYQKGLAEGLARARQSGLEQRHDDPNKP